MEEIYSIGVDIGTSTTNVVLSKIQVKTRMGSSLIPITSIGNTSVIYRSPVIFTPIKEGQQIDFMPIRNLVESGLQGCGLRKEQIETGAVIITGETARKKNAAGVGTALSDYLGDFVVACAGPQLESILAGHGAGACEYSKKNNKRVINLDIGGGTLNAAVFYCGELETAFAMDIGGRLVRIDEDDRVCYLSERIQFIVDDNNLPLKAGAFVDWSALQELCRHLAQDCIQVCGLKPLCQEAEQLFISPYETPEKIDVLMVSGGVGECLKHWDGGESVRDACRKYGDMGPMLAQEIKMAVQGYGPLYGNSLEGIRATVIGAGSNSMTVSGSTIGVEEEILPIKNVSIIKSHLKPGEWNRLSTEIEPLFSIYEDATVAIAIQGENSPSYERLSVLTNEIEKLYQDKDCPVILIMKEDFAKALNQMIHVKCRLSHPVICLDGIDSEQGDYIDIGTPMGNAVPVIVKTLVYQF